MGDSLAAAAAAVHAESAGLLWPAAEMEGRVGWGQQLPSAGHRAGPVLLQVADAGDPIPLQAAVMLPQVLPLALLLLSLAAPY